MTVLPRHVRAVVLCTGARQSSLIVIRRLTADDPLVVRRAFEGKYYELQEAMVRTCVYVCVYIYIYYVCVRMCVYVCVCMRVSCAVRMTALGYAPTHYAGSICMCFGNVQISCVVCEYVCCA